MKTKKKFWIVLTITLIVWIGVGIYYLTTRKSETSEKQPLQLPQSTKQEFNPWTADYSPNEPVLIAEGFYGIFYYQNSLFTLEADDKTYLFIIPKDIKRFIMPGTKFRLKVYYQEKNGELIFVSAERA